ncbi:DUF4817 domain-containing protein [Trichonephila clavipes]|nr:DUF4817 domain-containing protein [Trichonephila clavipes]
MADLCSKHKIPKNTTITRLLGHNLFYKRISGQSNLETLHEVLTKFLDDIFLLAIHDIRFKHDGCLLHSCALECALRDMAQHGREIKPRDLVIGPPRSPGLRKLKFFLWDHFKESNFVHVVITQATKVAPLNAACTSVDTTLLRCAHSLIHRRVQACFDMHSGSFEYLHL